MVGQSQQKKAQVASIVNSLGCLRPSKIHPSQEVLFFFFLIWGFPKNKKIISGVFKKLGVVVVVSKIIPQFFGVPCDFADLLTSVIS